MTTPSGHPIIFEKVDSIGRITLNRPEKLNAINTEMGREFVDALEECSSNDDIRAVLIRGEGRAFCSGDDIGPRNDSASVGPSGPDDPAQTARRPAYTRIISEIRQLPKPVVAALHGYTVGAGCDIALASDFRIVAEETKFGLVFVKRGIIGGTWMISQHIGLAKATELLLTGEMFDANTAQQLGLVTKLVPQAKLEEEAHAYTAQLAMGPTKIMGFIKLALTRGRQVEIDHGFEYQNFALSMSRQTEDGVEGRLAWRERRDPQFTGR